MVMDTRDMNDLEQFAAVFTAQENQRELDCLSRIRLHLLTLRRARVGPEWSTRGQPRNDGSHHVHFVCDGEAEVRFEGGRLALRPRRVYWLPAHVPFHCTCRRFYSHYFLTLRCEWAGGIDLFGGQRRPLCLGTWDPGAFVGAWRRRPLGLNAYWRLQGFLQQAFAEHVDRLDENVQQALRMHAEFGRVFDRLDRGGIASLHVADLARIQGVSLSAFSRSFRDRFGISPKTYLNRRLNAAACDLMLGTDLRARQVADRLGFTDEYYFNRFFSKMNRISPQRYRRRFLGNAGCRRAIAPPGS
jgi:AraC-like DNA-binding protein